MCLPTCPTYVLTGRERSSPRGRIALIRAVAEGDMALDSPVFQAEMSDCLGCLGCVTACPAGVQYGELLEAARDQLWRRWPWWKRMLGSLVLSIFDRPWLLLLGTRALFLYQKSGLASVLGRILPGKLREFHRMLPPAAWNSSRQRIPARTPGGRGRVGVLLGCVMDVAFAKENLATVNVLRRQGFQVEAPPQQPCCGALHAHSGRLDWARAQARRMIATFERHPVDWIVVNSAGCGSLMKHYGHLLAEEPEWADRAAAFSARVRDVQEFLAEIELRPPLPQVVQSLTYHDACHLAHGQAIRQAPRQLLRQLAGSGYRELAEADLCCGSAGTYNITHFETASELLERKLDAIEASGALRVGVANPGCLLQIRYGLARRGLNIAAEHPIVLLDEAWENSGSGNRTA
ncbi:MAG: (Fe-S)-binding protein [Candidatus Eremiobacteraeota bacterium]|nr:(Fe-S)-binding protein [Candidatus Eremiobacteraeota bacterium]MCW5869122.1 (Fe-S)-binding protein [Candidatus Eremiobacteraeota bacterium]